MGMGMGMGRGMSMGLGGRGATNLLPVWLAVIFTVVFVAVFVTHVQHARETRGQRRLWHVGHVAMACGMAFMYVPAAIDPFDLPARFWQILFVSGLLALAGGITWQLLNRRGPSALWLLIAIDIGAMIDMWSPGGRHAPLGWLLAAYLSAEAWLWSSDRIRRFDRGIVPSGYSVTSDGAIGIAAAEPLTSYRDLRISMCAMTLGMAYMLVAMQVMQ